MKQLVKVSVDQGANSHLPTISEALTFILLVFHQNPPLFNLWPMPVNFYQAGSCICGQRV